MRIPYMLVDQTRVDETSINCQAILQWHMLKLCTGNILDRLRVSRVKLSSMLQLLLSIEQIILISLVNIYVMMRRH